MKSSQKTGLPAHGSLPVEPLDPEDDALDDVDDVEDVDDVDVALPELAVPVEPVPLVPLVDPALLLAAVLDEAALLDAEVPAGQRLASKPIGTQAPRQISLALEHCASEVHG